MERGEKGWERKQENKGMSERSREKINIRREREMIMRKRKGR